MENGDHEMKRLYRSRTHRVIGGVCGGLAEYFEIDVAIMRVLFVLLAFAKGIGLLVYLVALFVVPTEPSAEAKPRKEQAAGTDGTRIVMIIFGALLILIGFSYFVQSFEFFPEFWFYYIPFHIGWTLFWPLLLILIGALYLIHVFRSQETERMGSVKEAEKTTPQKKLYRSRTDRKIAGVCGGLGEYFGIDPTIVRVLWAVLTVVTSLFIGIIVYIVMALVVPEQAPASPEKKENQQAQEEPHEG
jgi:phage shock protein PspC (stress-responsive transcriptional regulator)